MPFDCSEYPGNGGLVSYLDSGGEKAPLHFYHANGFPVSVYFPLLTEFAEDFRVLGLTMGGQDGQSEGISSWQGPADALNGFLRWMETGPVIGVGHSIGAVSTLFAAIKQPDLFSCIVLLDPVLLPRKIVFLTRLLRCAGQKGRYPLAVRARKRRNGWGSRREALDYFRGKSLFGTGTIVFSRHTSTMGSFRLRMGASCCSALPRLKPAVSRATRRIYGNGLQG